MRFFTAIASSLLTTLALTACGQSLGKRTIFGQAHAQQQVKSAMQGITKSLQPKILLPTQATAIAVAEPMLFNIYGERNIVKQRPYETHLVNGFWYIAGTLPEDYLGGVFEIIIDAKDSRVIFLSHGK